MKTKFILDSAASNPAGRVARKARRFTGHLVPPPQPYEGALMVAHFPEAGRTCRPALSRAPLAVARPGSDAARFRSSQLSLARLYNIRGEGLAVATLSAHLKDRLS